MRNILNGLDETSGGAPGAIRTRDTSFRRAVLYPLSYGGTDNTNQYNESPAAL